MSERCVLLVDDDAMNRFMLSEMLDMLGYAVREAPDGETAVQVAREYADQIGVILMDVHMPGVSGVQAVAEIRREAADPPARTPILAVTADEAWVTAGAAGQCGFSGSISKPVNLGALKARLTEIMP